MLVIDGNRILSMTLAEYEEWKWMSGEKEVKWT
jgi:hypothetical protein